ADRWRPRRTGSGGLLQLGARALPRLQRQLSHEGRDLSPQRQPRGRARRGGIRRRVGSRLPRCARCRLPSAMPAERRGAGARRGVTGPLEVFEGEKGFMDAVAGFFELNWETEDLERVTQTILKKYNAEIHSQSVLEAVLELRAREHLSAADVARVEIDVFDVAYRIIGGGEEGEKTVVHTKEAADHSLPYLVAVAILDGEVMPAQYRPTRIRSDDVQALLLRVAVRPDDAFSRRFP